MPLEKFPDPETLRLSLLGESAREIIRTMRLRLGMTEKV
jgi:hypothetical protein